MVGQRQLKLKTLSSTLIKNGQQDLDITFGFANSLFGECLLAYTQQGIINISFVQDDMSRQASINKLQQRWTGFELRKDNQGIKKLIDLIFTPVTINKLIPVDICMVGTPFQLKVWQMLLNIPVGHLSNYQDIAKKVGQIKAVRAVGNVTL